MFAKDPYEMVRMDTIQSDDSIHAHSCILKTVDSEPMRRLLNTYPPEQGQRTKESGSTRSGRQGDEHHNQQRASGGGSSEEAVETTRSDEKSSSSSGTNNTRPNCAKEPIRIIRFEDSPPAAVRAVVRYVYLGERPIVEANCEYTVKDLMALASFLGIEPLEEYCVALVLGLSQDCCCCESDDHGLLMCSRYSTCPDWQRTNKRSRIGADAYPTRRTRTSQEATMMMTMTPRESMLQTLFAWGYRFPRIEGALIEVLVSDHGKILSNNDENVLERFKDHQAFERILIEMMQEQIRQRRCDREKERV